MANQASDGSNGTPANKVKVTWAKNGGIEIVNGSRYHQKILRSNQI